MGTITYGDLIQSGFGMAFGFVMILISTQLVDKHPEFGAFGIFGMLFALGGFGLFMYKFFKKDKPEQPNRKEDKQ